MHRRSHAFVAVGFKNQLNRCDSFPNQRGSNYSRGNNNNNNNNRQQTDHLSSSSAERRALLQAQVDDFYTYPPQNIPLSDINVSSTVNAAPTPLTTSSGSVNSNPLVTDANVNNTPTGVHSSTASSQHVSRGQHERHAEVIEVCKIIHTAIVFKLLRSTSEQDGTSNNNAGKIKKSAANRSENEETEDKNKGRKTRHLEFMIPANVAPSSGNGNDLYNPSENSENSLSQINNANDEKFHIINIFDPCRPYKLLRICRRWLLDNVAVAITPNSENDIRNADKVEEEGQLSLDEMKMSPLSSTFTESHQQQERLQSLPIRYNKLSHELGSLGGPQYNNEVNIKVISTVLGVLKHISPTYSVAYDTHRTSSSSGSTAVNEAENQSSVISNSVEEQEVNAEVRTFEGENDSVSQKDEKTNLQSTISIAHRSIRIVEDIQYQIYQLRKHLILLATQRLERIIRLEAEVSGICEELIRLEDANTETYDKHEAMSVDKLILSYRRVASKFLSSELPHIAPVIAAANEVYSEISGRFKVALEVRRKKGPQYDDAVPPSESLSSVTGIEKLLFSILGIQCGGFHLEIPTSSQSLGSSLASSYLLEEEASRIFQSDIMPLYCSRLHRAVIGCLGTFFSSASGNDERGGESIACLEIEAYNDVVSSNNNNGSVVSAEVSTWSPPPLPVSKWCAILVQLFGDNGREVDNKYSDDNNLHKLFPVVLKLLPPVVQLYVSNQLQSQSLGGTAPNEYIDSTTPQDHLPTGILLETLVYLLSHNSDIIVSTPYTPQAFAAIIENMIRNVCFTITSNFRTLRDLRKFVAGLAVLMTGEGGAVSSAPSQISFNTASSLISSLVDPNELHNFLSFLRPKLFQISQHHQTQLERHKQNQLRLGGTSGATMTDVEMATASVDTGFYTADDPVVPPQPQSSTEEGATPNLAESLLQSFHSTSYIQTVSAELSLLAGAIRRLQSFIYERNLNWNNQHPLVAVNVSLGDVVNTGDESSEHAPQTRRVRRVGEESAVGNVTSTPDSTDQRRRRRRRSFGESDETLAGKLRVTGPVVVPIDVVQLLVADFLRLCPEEVILISRRHLPLLFHDRVSPSSATVVATSSRNIIPTALTRVPNISTLLSFTSSVVAMIIRTLDTELHELKELHLVRRCSNASNSHGNTEGEGCEIDRKFNILMRSLLGQSGQLAQALDIAGISYRTHSSSTEDVISNGSDNGALTSVFRVTEIIRASSSQLARLVSTVVAKLVQQGMFYLSKIKGLDKNDEGYGNSWLSDALIQTDHPNSILPGISGIVPFSLRQQALQTLVLILRMEAALQRVIHHIGRGGETSINECQTSSDHPLLISTATEIIALSHFFLIPVTIAQDNNGQSKCREYGCTDMIVRPEMKRMTAGPIGNALKEIKVIIDTCLQVNGTSRHVLSAGESALRMLQLALTAQPSPTVTLNITSSDEEPTVHKPQHTSENINGEAPTLHLPVDPTNSSTPHNRPSTPSKNDRLPLPTLLSTKYCPMIAKACSLQGLSRSLTHTNKQLGVIIEHFTTNIEKEDIIFSTENTSEAGLDKSPDGTSTGNTLSQEAASSISSQIESIGAILCIKVNDLIRLEELNMIQRQQSSERSGNPLVALLMPLGSLLRGIVTFANYENKVIAALLGEGLHQHCSDRDSGQSPVTKGMPVQLDEALKRKIRTMERYYDASSFTAKVLEALSTEEDGNGQDKNNNTMDHQSAFTNDPNDSAISYYPQVLSAILNSNKLWGRGATDAILSSVNNRGFTGDRSDKSNEESSKGGISFALIFEKQLDMLEDLKEQIIDMNRSMLYAILPAVPTICAHATMKTNESVSVIGDEEERDVATCDEINPPSELDTDLPSEETEKSLSDVLGVYSANKTLEISSIPQAHQHTFCEKELLLILRVYSTLGVWNGRLMGVACSTLTNLTRHSNSAATHENGAMNTTKQTAHLGRSVALLFSLQRSGFIPHTIVINITPSSLDKTSASAGLAGNTAPSSESQSPIEKLVQDVCANIYETITIIRYGKKPDGLKESIEEDAVNTRALIKAVSLVLQCMTPIYHPPVALVEVCLDTIYSHLVKEESERNANGIGSSSSAVTLLRGPEAQRMDISQAAWDQTAVPYDGILTFLDFIMYGWLPKVIVRPRGATESARQQGPTYIPSNNSGALHVLDTVLSSIWPFDNGVSTRFLSVQQLILLSKGINRHIAISGSYSVRHVQAPEVDASNAIPHKSANKKKKGKSEKIVPPCTKDRKASSVLDSLKDESMSLSFKPTMQGFNYLTSLLNTALRSPGLYSSHPKQLAKLLQELSMGVALFATSLMQHNTCDYMSSSNSLVPKATSLCQQLEDQLDGIYEQVVARNKRAFSMDDNLDIVNKENAVHGITGAQPCNGLSIVKLRQGVSVWTHSNRKRIMEALVYRLCLHIISQQLIVNTSTTTLSDKKGKEVKSIQSTNKKRKGKSAQSNGVNSLCADASIRLSPQKGLRNNHIVRSLFAATLSTYVEETSRALLSGSAGGTIPADCCAWALLLLRFMDSVSYHDGNNEKSSEGLYGVAQSQAHINFSDNSKSTLAASLIKIGVYKMKPRGAAAKGLTSSDIVIRTYGGLVTHGTDDSDFTNYNTSSTDIISSQCLTYSGALAAAAAALLDVRGECLLSMDGGVTQEKHRFKEDVKALLQYSQELFVRLSKLSSVSDKGLWDIRCQVMLLRTVVLPDNDKNNTRDYKTFDTSGGKNRVPTSNEDDYMQLECLFRRKLIEILKV